MARTLNTAYGDGLLSQATLVQRLDQLFGSELVDPARLVGDLTFRGAPGRLRSRLRHALGRFAPARTDTAAMLALDWSGAQDELLLGRHHGCDVVLSDESVSRRHAHLRFRDGHWIVRDLDSTNGTTVNGARVVRCRLLPGDVVALGDELLVVD